jgi:dTDP-4-amino-4,6-dideoxygalactose transaminase
MHDRRDEGGMIRLAKPAIDDDDVEAVVAALRSGNLVQGERVAAFEAECSAVLGGGVEAVAVTNCTAALQLALLALGVGPGDVVAVTAYSWISTANVVELCGATPLFVDIDVATHNMAPAALAAALERAPGPVKAILPVHTFGQVAELSELSAIAGDAGIPMVEDAACALGARHDGRPAGTVGALGCFSFHPRKAITTGEGGLVVTVDAALADAVRALSNHGLDPNAPSPDFVRAGFNCRLTEMQAALGATQLAKLDRLVAERREQAARYGSLLDGLGLTLPAPREPERHVYQSYVVLLPSGLGEGAPPRFVAAMRERGVETTIGTWHMPLTTHFRTAGGHRRGDFPATDEVFDRAVSLPLWSGLTEDDQKTVATAVADTLAGL